MYLVHSFTRSWFWLFHAAWLSDCSSEVNAHHSIVATSDLVGDLFDEVCHFPKLCVLIAFLPIHNAWLVKTHAPTSSLHKKSPVARLTTPHIVGIGALYG